jgi:SAM-dependent methyltransferase
MAEEACRYGEVVATDADEAMIAFARERKSWVDFRCDSIGCEGFTECFDVVLSLDVLYHRSIEDWREALRVLAGALVPRGVLIVQVPAYAWLAGRHDAQVGGRRRFSPRELRRAVCDVGLRVRLFSHRFALLTPLVWFRRAFPGWSREGGDLDVSAGGGCLGLLIERALRWEAALILGGFSLEVGSSLFVVAERGGE